MRIAKAAELKSNLLDALQLPTLVLPRYSLVRPGSSADDAVEEACYVNMLDDENLVSNLEQSRVEEHLNSKKVGFALWEWVLNGVM